MPTDHKARLDELWADAYKRGETDSCFREVLSIARGLLEENERLRKKLNPVVHFDVEHLYQDD